LKLAHEIKPTMKISKDIMLKCAALLAVFVTTNARDESLRGANSPVSSKTAIIDDADHWKDYELEPMEDPNPSTGGGSLDDIHVDQWHDYTCYRERKALNDNDGYCEPWGKGGDLCIDEPKLPACNEAKVGNPNGAYLPATWSELRVRFTCYAEPKCKGYTWKKALGQGKLKSAISSVVSGGNNGYKCYEKGYQTHIVDGFMSECKWWEERERQESQKEETK